MKRRKPWADNEREIERTDNRERGIEDEAYSLKHSVKRAASGADGRKKRLLSAPGGLGKEQHKNMWACLSLRPTSNPTSCHAVLSRRRAIRAASLFSHVDSNGFVLRQGEGRYVRGETRQHHLQANLCPAQILDQLIAERTAVAASPQMYTLDSVSRIRPV